MIVGADLPRHDAPAKIPMDSAGSVIDRSHSKGPR